MEHRILGRTGLSVSEIGLGCEHLQGQSSQAVRAIVDEALAGGINILDIFMSEPQVRSNIGDALAGRRSQVILQGHIGAAWMGGQYSRTRKRAECKTFFEDFLKRLRTDYVDIGMLHFVDTEEDYRRVFESDVIEYALELKKSGVIRALGMSSHDPVVSLKAVQTGLIDVLMFSLNPAYDLLPEDTLIDDLFAEKSYRNEQLNGINPVRETLYRTCEAMGVGITVMKGLAAGALLKAETSPFGTALTPVQCIHYALQRPAVASVMVGVHTPEEVTAALAYEQADASQRDYSVLLSQTPKYSLYGKCMYCNHCLPCPSQLDVAQINKYLDLAQLQSEVPPTVAAHYAALAHHAGECISCGSCERNCPFHVPVIQKMQQACTLFGR